MQFLEWIDTTCPKFYLVAFANWECIEENKAANRWFFEDENPNPYPYYIKKRKATFYTSTQTLTASLNPFFSYIVAVQGGIKGRLSQELEVRATTEEFLSKAFEAELDIENPGMGIPIVQILIGGHLGDLEHVAKSVASEIPVVICQG